MVQEVLDQGADVNDRDKDGSSALHLASIGDHEEAVRLLLSDGADVNALDDHSNTPLIAACGFFHGAKLTGSCESVVRLLLEGSADCNAQDDMGRTALYNAIHHWKGAIIPLLLEYGADVNTKDCKRDEAIRIVPKCCDDGGPVEVIDLLLDHGAHFDNWGKGGKTALIMAAGNGQAAAAGLLLGKGANVNYRSNRGHTALLRASGMGDGVMVRLLLDHGADCNIPDKHGWTALMEASVDGNDDVVKLLLEGGADVEAVYGKTALDRARERDQKGIVQLLEAVSSHQLANELSLPYLANS